MKKYNIAEIAKETFFPQIEYVMKTKSLKLSVQRGFSLVELLVVIAVIAIIAAIAIPNIANITQQANAAKSQRNAQNIASVAAAAIAAGYVAPWTDAQSVYDDLAIDGVQVTVGANEMQFGVSPMSVPEQTLALGFLTVTPATATVPAVVTYNPAGPAVPTPTP